MSYRKFWSRIERATARLIGEWQVHPGDIVAYWGCGHQDALMLYIAVARCGARLLPLEHMKQRQDGIDFLQQHRAKVLLHDDALSGDVPSSADTVSNLSSLIATRCFHHPAVVEKDTSSSLMMLSRTSDGGLVRDEHSLAQLMATNAAATSPFEVSRALFDMDVLAHHVLPLLAARGTIVFR